jgi:hypothetical protein
MSTCGPVDTGYKHLVFLKVRRSSSAMLVDTSSVVVGLAHFSHSMSSENSIRGKSSEKGNDLIAVDLIAVVGATIAFTDT